MGRQNYPHHSPEADSVFLLCWGCVPSLEQINACLKDRPIPERCTQSHLRMPKTNESRWSILFVLNPPPPHISDRQSHPRLRNTNKKTTLCILSVSKIQPTQTRKRPCASSLWARSSQHKQENDPVHPLCEQDPANANNKTTLCILSLSKIQPTQTRKRPSASSLWARSSQHKQENDPLHPLCEQDPANANNKTTLCILSVSKIQPTQTRKRPSASSLWARSSQHKQENDPVHPLCEQDPANANNKTTLCILSVSKIQPTQTRKRPSASSLSARSSHHKQENDPLHPLYEYVWAISGQKETQIKTKLPPFCWTHWWQRPHSKTDPLLQPSPHNNTNGLNGRFFTCLATS